VSYLERTVVGLNPDSREQLRDWLCTLGEVAAERADIPAARFIDRRLAELSSRHVHLDQEPLLDATWTEALWEELAEIRENVSPELSGRYRPCNYPEDVRDWANGVLTLLDDMRRHPERFG
jgi:hypothetical protein